MLAVKLQAGGSPDRMPWRDPPPVVDDRGVAAASVWAAALNSIHMNMKDHLSEGFIGSLPHSYSDDFDLVACAVPGRIR